MTLIDIYTYKCSFLNLHKRYAGCTVKPGRENHVIALYKHNDWPFDEKQVFSHEWEAIQKAYLNITPLLRLVCLYL